MAKQMLALVFLHAVRLSVVGLVCVLLSLSSASCLYCGLVWVLYRGGMGLMRLDCDSQDIGLCFVMHAPTLMCIHVRYTCRLYIPPDTALIAICQYVSIHSKSSGVLERRKRVRRRVKKRVRRKRRGEGESGI